MDVGAGLPGFSIVGLPDAAVQEARERVRVAISNSGYKFPTRKVIVNLAPASLRKEGPAFDLPIALAVLTASGTMSQEMRYATYSLVCYDKLLPIEWSSNAATNCNLDIRKHTILDGRSQCWWP